MRIFYDVDTQNDFMNKSGALSVPGAEEIKPQLKLLTNFALDKKIPIIASADRHFGTEAYQTREGELNQWGGPFPHHCMDDTYGAEKISETSFLQRDSSPIYIEHRLDGSNDEVHIGHALIEIRNPQTEHVVIEKQSYDVFTNPSAEQLMKRAGVTDAIVYGVATDYCVKAAVLGMQRLGINCYVVEDAIRGVFPESTKTALEEMAAAGAKFVTTRDVLEGRV